MEAEATATASTKHGEASKTAAGRTVVIDTSRGGAVSGVLSVVDLIPRVVAVDVATAGSAIAMGTTNQKLPFLFTQLLRFKAQHSDLPSLTLFVPANSIVAAYPVADWLVLSIPLSVLHVIRSRARHSRLVLIFVDTVMMAMVTAAAAAAAIVYLVHCS
ncbi:LOW QUALITY PROTEIN: casparian strip membrane protein 4-like [Oryza brachyantha]|uniref:LOW QUALITY PROTEIN: casparian strip membrane protein 4-like n=1 Tax=Oryza brachyantha TaxID=4533 RepID=UPI001ADD58F9|nr:LOW QUALITY PROTEIN: casparian strip membrane protein 4-like [Oryza brachyantha]